MNPVHHSLCNRVIPPAPGDEGEVLPLPIRIDQDGFTSFWRPNESELEMLRNGGSIAQRISSPRLPPSCLYVVAPDGSQLKELSIPDVAVEVCAMIDELRAGSGESVTFHSTNDDFNNLPQCLITCIGDWTAWEEMEFRNDSFLGAMRVAVSARRQWHARNPNGLPSPDKTKPPVQEG